MTNRSLISSLRRKFPSRFLTLEVANICNLRCPLCSTGSGLSPRPKGMMDYEKYAAFVDEVAPLFDSIAFVGSGEPFVHPRILDFVTYAARKRKLTVCSTNGTMVKEPEPVVRSGLHSIHFAVDGVTQEQHETYRRGSDLDLVLGNIAALADAKRRLRSPYPIVYIDTLLTRYNEMDYDRFIEQAKRVRANAIRFRGINDDVYHETDWFPTQERFRTRKREPDGRCYASDKFAGNVAWDGEIQLCCMTPHHDEPVIKLNAFETDNLLEALDADELEAATRRAGRYPFCETCYFQNYREYFEIVHLRGMTMPTVLYGVTHPAAAVRKTFGERGMLRRTLTGRRKR